MQGDDNQELVRRFESSRSFKNEMEAVSRKFMEFEQQIYYSPIKNIHPAMIIHLDGINQFTGNQIRRREELYIINGQYQPTGPQSFERLVLQIVQSIPRPKNPLGFIYVNTLAESNAYDNFKKVLQLLPVQYLFNLTKIYVMDASFFSKALTFLSFGTITNYLKNKTVNVQNLFQLNQLARVDFNLLSKVIPKNVILSLSEKEKNQKIIFQSQRLHSIELNFLNQGMARSKSEDSKDNQNTLFPIVQAQDNPLYAKKLISDYEVGPSGAPVILQMLIYFFSNNDNYLKQEGLFRKSVSIDDETEILRQLNNHNYNYLATITNPHIIANAIKRFLANFKEPLIPYNLFDAFMERDSDPNYNSFVVESVKQLPKTNRLAIFLLFEFLRNKVIPFESDNKMGQKNLCIVFGPCLMRAQVASIKELIYAKKVIVAASIIFKEFQTIFGDHSVQARLKRNSYLEYRIEQTKQKSSKEITNLNTVAEDEVERQSKQEKILNKTSQYIKEALVRTQSLQSDDEEPSKSQTQEVNKAKPQ